MRAYLLGWAAFAALSFVGVHAEEALIPNDASFGDTFKKELTEQMGLGGKTRPLLIEVGVKGGANYRFFHSDGSGTFAGDSENDISHRGYRNRNWSAACNKDVMTDVVWCRAILDGFRVYYSEGSGFLVNVLGEKYPGTDVFVRVDGGEVFSANGKSGFNGRESSKILKAIKDGSSVSTRYVDWPHNVNRDKKFDVYGLSAVMEYMRWVVDVSE